MKKKIKLSIQEIVDDYYRMGQEEGYLSGLCDANYCNDENKYDYHAYMISLIDKYLPNWRDKINEEYWSDDIGDDEKGLILSTTLHINFKEIFYQLI